MDVFSDQDKALTLNRWKLNGIDNIATGIWVVIACQCLIFGFQTDCQVFQHFI